MTRGPSWRTVLAMEQARWLRTAKTHAAVLPPNLEHLADAESINSHDCRKLAAFCQHHSLPIARAGRPT